MVVRGKINGFISWNGWYYGYIKLKRENKYYRSKNVRFDDTCGGTEECTEEQYVFPQIAYKLLLYCFFLYVFHS